MNKLISDEKSKFSYKLLAIFLIICFSGVYMFVGSRIQAVNEYNKEINKKTVEYNILEDSKFFILVKNLLRNNFDFKDSKIYLQDEKKFIINVEKNIYTINGILVLINKDKEKTKKNFSIKIENIDKNNFYDINSWNLVKLNF